MAPNLTGFQQHLEASQASLYLATDRLVNIAVDSSDVDDALQSLRGLLVLGRQLLAVAAPWRVELDDPDAVAVLDPVVEVVVGEFDNP